MAAGEPMPGVSLELRMPSLMVVAGTMVAPSFVVRNDSSQEVTLSAGVTSVRNPAEPPRTPDPREFLAIPRT
ncbi:MAG TPA: hypothetical protein VGJ60_26390, partial [Chloroflexota bacterium]